MGAKKRSSRRKYRLLRQLFLLLILVFVLAGGYYYLKVYTHEPTVALDSSVSKMQYSTLENPDSTNTLAVIIYDKNVNINTIAETFYKSDIFWPYIYLANKSVMKNPLNIDADIVLKIPRIPNHLLNLQDTTSVNRVKMIADSILNSITEPPL